MRKIVATLFFLAFSLQVFSPAILFIDYQLHFSDYLAKCVNRSKPELKCNGKCQLNKKMAEQEKQSDQLPTGKSSNRENVLSSRSYPPFYAALLIFNNKKPVSSYIADKPFQLAYSIFHPPQLI